MAELPRRTSGSERNYGSGVPVMVTLLFLLAIAAIFAFWLTRDLEESHEDEGSTSIITDFDSRWAIPAGFDLDGGEKDCGEVATSGAV